jgi:hypothetical protein
MATLSSKVSPSGVATAAQGGLADSAVQPNDSPTFAVVTATSYAGDGSALTGIPLPPSQTTAVWEAGTDTTESVVSAAKVAAAIAAIPSAAIFGGGATYQNLTASRAHSTSYQNTTGHYIFVAITAAILREVQVSVDNSTWIRVGRFFDSSADATQVSFPVPDLWYYRINGSVNDLYWAELRP